MMRALRVVALVVLAALGGTSPGRVLAEVSGTPGDDGTVETLVMADTAITDGVDPISLVWEGVWTAHRPVPASWILNPSGDARGDGRPDVVFRAGTGVPVVVWAYNRGTSHDIALSHWQDGGWSPIEMITNTPHDEVDPRVFVRADGALYVVWGVAGADPRVELTSRAAFGDFWTAPVRVNPLGEPARRPSVAGFGGAVWVAYERETQSVAFDTTEVVLRRQVAPGPFVLERTLESDFDGPVDPVLHVQSGNFWLDWRYSEDEFAYVEINAPTSGWLNLENCEDSTWVGTEDVRLRIARLVGLPPHPPADTPLVCCP